MGMKPRSAFHSAFTSHLETLRKRGLGSAPGTVTLVLPRPKKQPRDSRGRFAKWGTPTIALEDWIDDKHYATVELPGPGEPKC